MCMWRWVPATRRQPHLSRLCPAWCVLCGVDYKFGFLLDKNECVENATLCSIIDGQVCKNLDGSFNCSCPDGTEVAHGRCVCKLPVIATCRVRIAVVLWLVSNECASSPCQNGAACIDGVGVFTCRCTCGFTGVLCESGEWMIDFLSCL